MASARMHLGRVWRALGDEGRARVSLEETLGDWRRLGNQERVASTMRLLEPAEALAAQ